MLYYHKAETTIADITKLLLVKASTSSDDNEEAVDLSPLVKLCEYHIKVLNAYAATRRTADSGKDVNATSNRPGGSSSTEFVVNAETQHVSSALTSLHSLLMFGNCSSPNAIECLIVRCVRLLQLCSLCCLV